jgi:hypothetical protein
MRFHVLSTISRRRRLGSRPTRKFATKDKIAKVEVEIKRILKSVGKDANGDAAPADGDDEVPADSAPPSVRGDTPDAVVPAEGVETLPEEVKVDDV